LQADLFSFAAADKYVSMARTASERLALYESIRDKVEGALMSGAPIVSYTLDGQMVQKEATSAWLAELDSRIADLRRQAGTGLMASRNLVRFQ
jgi:hypothetical protein